MIFEKKMEECCICYDEIVYYFECENKKCNIKICNECMESYIDFALKEEELPICPNSKCKYNFLLKNMKKIEKLENKYIECCTIFLYNKYINESKKEVEILNKIDKFRKTREKFLTEKFPLAITFTAKLIMKDKLCKINKQIKEKYKKEIVESKKICYNLICDGYLNSEYECTKCDTAFCNLCEKIKEVGHECNKEDIESLEYIKTLVHCPNCNITIIKQSGCNHMTCASCRFKFNYNEGTKSESGSTNILIEKPKEKYILSELYKEELENKNLLNIMLEIEKCEPIVEKTNTKHIIKIFVKNNVDLENITFENKKELCKIYEKMYIKEKYIKYYLNIVNDINNKITNKNINKEYMNKILTCIKNY